jgi:hypothetical protein
MSREKRLIASECLSVYPSIRIYRLGSQSTDFRETWCWKLLLKSVNKIQIWLKSDKNIGRFIWTPQYGYIFHSITKYFIVRQQCEGSHCWASMETLNSFILLAAACDSATQSERIVAFQWQHFQYFCVVESDMCSSTINRTQCCLSMATTITRTRHNVALYVHCHSCYTMDLHILDQYLPIFYGLNLFIHQNHILPPEQFGFRKEHSTVHQLASITHFITHGFILKTHRHGSTRYRKCLWYSLDYRSSLQTYLTALTGLSPLLP